MTLIGEEIGLQVRAHILRTYRKQKHAAERWGISQAFISKVVTGKVPPPKWLLDEMGLVRRVIYMAKDDALW